VRLSDGERERLQEELDARFPLLASFMGSSWSEAIYDQFKDIGEAAQDFLNYHDSAGRAEFKQTIAKILSDPEACKFLTEEPNQTKCAHVWGGVMLTMSDLQIIARAIRN
jgi:hypothetical protein